MDNLLQKTERYFELFSTKNVKGLENEIYADNISLRDWNGQWKGKQAVLEMNENLFINDFKINIEEIRVFDMVSMVTFKLSIADSEYTVLDIIDWNSDGKIERILAFNR